MASTRSFIVGIGALVFAEAAYGQPAQPPPDQPAPPPQAPPPNWAPPPQETPPPDTTATPEQPTVTVAAPAPAPAPEPSTKLEVYGFVMVDVGYDFGQVGDPNWSDTLRPTKLPAFDDQFGKGGRTFAGVRQTRFGVKADTPSPAGNVKTTFEFEMFGVGSDEGQTTIRLRHAVGDWKTLRAGQTWSPFMDIDVFPNTVEYWGPNGMPFYRNVQVAWMPIQGDSRVTIAAERPGGSADRDSAAERIELDNIVARFPAPDISAEGRYGGDWGYVEAAGILRYLAWDDLDDASPDLDGHVWGWGLTVSSNLKLGPATLRLQGIYGEAVENYMNDGGSDVGLTSSDPADPIDGEALPVLGLVAFADINWDKKFSTAIGWSMVWIDNSDGQTAEAFHLGHYAVGNLMWRPTENTMMGGELQYGRRENHSGDFDSNDVKLQFSFKYNFSKTFGGE